MRAFEDQFEKNSRLLTNELERFIKKERKTQDQIKEYQTNLKNLRGLYIQMEKYNSGLKDPKQKKPLLVKCDDKIKNISSLLKQAHNKYNQFERAKLFAGADLTNPSTKLSDQGLMEDNIKGFKKITHEAHTIKQQTGNIVNQLVDDNDLLDQMGTMRQDIDNDINVSARLMKRQKNQQLLKRVTLFGLAGFLTLADIILLVLKIT